LGLRTTIIPGGQTQVFNIRRIQRINCYLSESDEDSTPETISDNQNWPVRNGAFNNLNDSKEDCVADAESYIELGNGLKTSKIPEHQVVSAAVTGVFKPLELIQYLLT
jgi:hypothetical protein